MLLDVVAVAVVIVVAIPSSSPAIMDEAVRAEDLDPLLFVVADNFIVVVVVTVHCARWLAE